MIRFQHLNKLSKLIHCYSTEKRNDNDYILDFINIFVILKAAIKSILFVLIICKERFSDTVRNNDPSLLWIEFTIVQIEYQIKLCILCYVFKKDLI